MRLFPRSSRNSRMMDLEPLELRQLMSATVRSIDGTGNNLLHPEWGSVGEQLLRIAVAAYADGMNTPGGEGRPSPRMISNVLSSLDDPEGLLNNRDLSAFVYAWGQFLDHDLDLTVGGAAKEAYNVSVPMGDLQFDPTSKGDKWIYLTRSAYDPTTGTSVDNPRQQVTSITAWIDGSVVYGSDAERAAALRTFVGGKLKTSDGNLMPFNSTLLPNANDAHLVPDAELFLGGDVRANENIELTSIQTLFVREHNRLATEIASSNRRLSDEEIYQRARAIVGAEIQNITYNEWIPAVLGANAMSRYRGYRASVNPGISNEFSTAAFRLGHSMLGNDVEFIDNNGEEIAEELALANAFFNPGVVEETGIGPILKYLASDRMQEVDVKVVEGVRNFLFGPPGAGGFDLVSLNIQRGREHGLADYNSMREAFGLRRVNSFDDITSNVDLQEKLKSLYGTVDNIDAWVGGLAEDHVRGASVGPLVQRILVDQFTRLRDGDRFWYQRQFSGRQLASIENTSLSDIVKRNTDTKNIQENVFVFDVFVQGTVFNDRDGNGRQGRRESGLPGWTVQLLDAQGNVLDEATTRWTGGYSLSGLDLGAYTLRAVAPNGWSQPVDSEVIEVTRAQNFRGVNFASTRITPTFANKALSAFGSTQGDVDEDGLMQSILGDNADLDVLS